MEGRTSKITHKSKEINGKGTRVGLAYQNLTSLPESIQRRFISTCTILDLTYNSFQEFKFLLEMPNLEILILDHNQLTTQVSFPFTPRLTTLWVNNNNITNLSFFISNIERSFPNLRVLSMMNNEAAPSYFNDKTYMEHVDYRHFVVSRLRLLEMLDEKIVTEVERREAERIYPRHTMSIMPNMHQR